MFIRDFRTGTTFLLSELGLVLFGSASLRLGSSNSTYRNQMNKRLLFLLLIIFGCLSSSHMLAQDTALTPNDAIVTPTPKKLGEKDRDTSAAKRKRVVIVRPIILCDDDGTKPAAFSLPKKLVDRVYTKADLEFLYMPTQTWNFSAGRQGNVNLDTLVRRGWANGKICPDKCVVTLLFVSNVDGNEGPLGRGLQNGNICFVCLGPEPKNNEAGMEEFVIAHEVGHCLNLRHTVDDPNVPNDLVNLQGDGPYKDRLAVEGLHDTQRDTVLKSALVSDRVKFYSKEDSVARLTDETWEPYLSHATADMLRFSLGLAANDSIPDSPKLMSKYAELRFTEFAAEFSKEEKETLSNSIKELERLTGDEWPLLSRFPWNFIKVDSGFCSDFPHTRGLSIVLSARVLQKMKDDPVFAMTILLHEKIHVLQRVNAPSFEKLYGEYGYTKFLLDPKSKTKLNLAQNPDALSSTWSFQIDGKQHLLATEIETHDNRLVFAEKLFPLSKTSDKSFSTEAAIEISKVEEFKKQFAIPTGYDHPNEVAAHTSRYLLHKDFLKLDVEASDLNKKYAELTRREFKKIFSSIGDN